MKLIFVLLVSFSFIESFQSKTVQDFHLTHYLDDGVQLLKKVASDSNEYLVKESKVIQPLLHNYMIAKLKQNSLKALRKLSENWRAIKTRTGRQEDEAIGAIPVTSITSSSELTFASINAGFRVANDVISSLFSILRTTFGYTPPKPGLGTDNTVAEFQTAASVVATPAKGTSRRGKDYKDLANQINNLRDKTYSEQLTGVLSILARQSGPTRLKSESIKDTVDYMLNVYVATHGKTQALFLPQIFEGIPRETIHHL